MIEFSIDADKKIVTVQPKAALTKNDFVKLGQAVDQYLENNKKLKGLIIYAHEFPGWHDFSGFIEHIIFLRDHHQEIEKVAIVSDAKVADILPKIGNHFVAADVRAFDLDALDTAKNWVNS